MSETSDRIEHIRRVAASVYRPGSIPRETLIRLLASDIPWLLEQVEAYNTGRKQ